jgi:apolipoprotein D and lipocalin family protein
MFRIRTAVLLTVAKLLSFYPLRAAGNEQPLPVVLAIDPQRYAGKWFEIARLPNRFQRDCTSGVTATYSVQPNGKIAVLNQCRAANGRIKSAKGTARLADSNGPNTKLKVTFFWPFSGDYWIIDLDPDYRWAVVGEPERKYFWVLSREPQMPEPLFRQILDRATQKGYTLDSLIKTAQP